jgi:hypothetical protein
MRGLVVDDVVEVGVVAIVVDFLVDAFPARITAQ